MSGDWLSRPQAVRRLWQGFVLVLVLCVLAELATGGDAHFAVQQWFGFNALFGFLACAALILVARGIGLLLKRPDDYYADEADD